MDGTADKLSGKAKQVVGQATDNKKLQAGGKGQEMKGDVKNKLKNVGKKLTDN